MAQSHMTRVTKTAWCHAPMQRTFNDLAADLLQKGLCAHGVVVQAFVLSNWCVEQRCLFNPLSSKDTA